ncbi:MAG: hypothetical protein F6K42_26215 [Leptolyngbya sp. SIO1D8]|nr:hypothetical protein [Leptolyngbya sp. SIO1D8]
MVEIIAAIIGAVATIVAAYISRQPKSDRSKSNRHQDNGSYERASPSPKVYSSENSLTTALVFRRLVATPLFTLAAAIPTEFIIYWANAADLRISGNGYASYFDWAQLFAIAIAVISFHWARKLWGNRALAVFYFNLSVWSAVQLIFSFDSHDNYLLGIIAQGVSAIFLMSSVIFGLAGFLKWQRS